MDTPEPQPDLSHMLTPDDLEVLAMSNTTGCDFPPDTSDDDEQASEAWD